MTDYYREKLSGERLRRCYEIAPARVRQYLEAEIRHVQSQLTPKDVVLELGCGYGRIVMRLAKVAWRIIGIDNSEESIKMAQAIVVDSARCEFLCADALALCFPEGAFDAVLCLQNGICSFGVDQQLLLREALRVTGEGGVVLLSTYSDKFWRDRLAWFEIQAAEGLVGPIDYSLTGGGTIVCTDGFQAGRLLPEDLHSLCSGVNVESEIKEVDGSTVFLKIVKPRAIRHG